MARTQFTFTFTNAQPGSVVSFSDGVLDHLYADASSSTRVGRPLVLDSSNALSVWSDVETLTATTEDGVGNDISATATRANPSVTTDAGTAGQNPFGGSLADSRLSAQGGTVVNMSSGAGTMSWVVADTPAGTDITIDGLDPTKINVIGPATYLVQAFVAVGGGTATSAGLSITPQGADGGLWGGSVFPGGGAFGTPLTPGQVSWYHFPLAGGYIKIDVSAVGAGTGDTVQGSGIDIVRIA